ncbi:periplasmic heavy metal sensor [Inquilinus limosus]|uniref:periplasmic heavy metal sensor n=1 Tax=Inquilinus limosus TaxID=171674 RepID=UPI000421D8BD
MTAAPRRRTMLVLAIALAASLCLNLFAGGAWLAGRWLDRRVEAVAASVMRPYPPELRRDVLRRLLQDRAELRAAVAGLLEARQRMFALMRADPLDRAALEEAMAEVRTRTGALQALLQSALADSLMETPAEERREIRSPGLGLLDDRE